jgi:hypothetical protein
MVESVEEEFCKRKEKPSPAPVLEVGLCNWKLKYVVNPVESGCFRVK